MADGLLQQEFGSFDRQLPEAFQYAQGYNNVLEKALDTLALRKAQQQREQYNNLMLDKAQKMSPLDIMKSRAEAAKAEAMSTPDMLQSAQEGYKAQNLLQKLAAGRAEATQESKINAENAGFNSETIKDKLTSQLRQHLDLSQNQNVPENMRIAAMQQAQALTDTLARYDPSFLQKQWLQDERLQNMLESMGLRLSAKEAEKEKPKTLSQMEAMFRQRLAVDPTDQEAKAFLAELEGYKVRTNPNAGAVTFDPTSGKLVTKGQAAAQTGSRGPALGTKDNPIKLD